MAPQSPTVTADTSADELHHLLDIAPHNTQDLDEGPSIPLMPLAGTSIGRRIRDRGAQGLTALAFAAAVLPLASILWLVIGHGAGRLDRVFLNNSVRNIAESDQGGGAYHAILGTLEQAGPVGVAGRRTTADGSIWRSSRLMRSMRWPSSPIPPSTAVRTTPETSTPAKMSGSGPCSPRR